MNKEELKELHGYDGKDIGVIAQEVLEVLPEVVKKEDDGYYSVAYGNMVGLLIESIKEQQKQIEVLTEENLVYRKHIMRLLQNSEGGNTEFTRDLMSLAGGSSSANNREPGGGTVQGAGFRR